MEGNNRKQREHTKNEKYNPHFIFNKKNYKVMIVGVAVIILGFILMSGGGSDDPNKFNPAIFNWQRIRLAPAIVLLGFGIEVYAILLNPEKKK